MLNKRTGYTATYRSKEAYYKLFNEAGFVLHKEVILDEVAGDRRMGFISQGCIWRRNSIQPDYSE